MPKETLGYTYTYWTCPSCGTKNLGTLKTCSGCSAAQPENVQFEQAGDEKLITDQAEIAAAQIGPDIHCPFCGTRNPADAKKCSQCGGDLQEGTARQAGAILGAHSAGPAPQISCPSCGTLNPADAPNCSSCGAALGAQQSAAPAEPPPSANKGCRWSLIGLAALVLIGIIYGVSSCWPKNAIGSVSSVAWQRSIAIQELHAVQYEDWEKDIPAGADIGSCSSRQSGVQDEPAANATKVCGTPYSRDLGNGRAEVLQDCSYYVYDEYCSYTVQEWTIVDTLQAQGSDYSPMWPRVSLGANQREGDRTEAYTITFLSDDKSYTYVTDDVNIFSQCQPNTTWRLVVSGSRVTSISPG